jgi:hypothetical protein
VPKIAARSWNKRLDWPEKGGSRAEVLRGGNSEISSALRMCSNEQYIKKLYAKTIHLETLATR